MIFPTNRNSTVGGLAVLGFYFTNKHGERIDLSKVNIHRVYLKLGKREIDLNDIQFCHARKSISVFINFRNLVDKPAMKFQLHVDYSYRNNPEVKSYYFTYNFNRDSNLQDYLKRENTPSNRRK